MDARLRAVCDLSVPDVREAAGLHEYDGVIQDLSPDGVRAGLSRLGGERLDDPHDEAHLAAFEESLRVCFGDLELHRRDPLYHIANLDLAGYDRSYAPAEERAEARRRHVAAWPEAIEMAIASLDRVSAPVAAALLVTVKGLAAGVETADGAGSEPEAAALAAHARLVAHVERAARDGDPDPSLGAPALARLLGAGEAAHADLTALAERADAERARVTAILDDACARIDRGRPAREIIPELMDDHPDADGVLQEARSLTHEVIEFARERELAPYIDGECLVGPAPESRRWTFAMMSWAAPGEPESPSWYYVTPPEPTWPEHEVKEWLSAFNRTTLPAITVHEVAPGHFAHGRALRRAPTPVRRLLHSMPFCEGWAHYVEELCVEEGFRADDPRYAVGVCIEALIRVTRLTCAIGLHTGAMDVAQATQRFMTDAHLSRVAAASEARRGTFDATYGRYTWGKLAILDLRERARQRWQDGFSLQRFHKAMLDLGSPPLGLLDTALDRG